MVRYELVGNETAEKRPLTIFMDKTRFYSGLSPLDFDDIRELGRGSFGTATLVRASDNGSAEALSRSELCAGRLYVLKAVNIAELRTQKAREQAHAELEVLSRLRHPHVVAYHGAYLHEQHLNIVLEYADAGDLADAIKDAKSSGRSFTPSLVAEWLAQLASALEYVHSMKVIHRDLKTSNVLLVAQDDAPPLLKVADFGIARQMSRTASLATTVVGTPYYMVSKHSE